MSGRKAWVVALAMLTASVIAIAAAPAQPATHDGAGSGPESNEQIVADFLSRKLKAERAQGAVIRGLRKSLDQKREEFERASRRFDQARGVDAEIVGPSGSQGVMNPTTPACLYGYELRKTSPEPPGGGAEYRRHSPVTPGAPIRP